ncbi:MAG: hypothetical protein LBH11_04505, partial [Propionibacteriaceae bacterium]|nr:hypothetical protein [Propionibacteriaceae bacterium]
VKRDSQLEVISSTNNTLEVVNLVNSGTDYYYGAHEKHEDTDSPTVARYGDLYAQGDTNVKTLVNGLSGTKDLVGSDVSRPADQWIDGATPAQNNGYAFTDVKVIDGRTFQGNLKLNAILTEHVVGKYMTLKDQANHLAGADNVTFEYKLGGNSDVFDLAISAANLSAAGTTTREDFILEINGGAGNNKISTAIFGESTPAKTAPIDNAQWNQNTVSDGLYLASANDATPWYVNSKQTANLSINAGTENDVVNTFGSGDWKVTLGTGSDTYYADNTGKDITAGIGSSTGRATWVFNTSDQSNPTNVVAARALDDLTSGDNSAYLTSGGVGVVGGIGTAIGSLYGLKLRVVFQDVSQTTTTGPDAAHGQGVFISRVIEVQPTAKSRYLVDDLAINQAIKKAINDDPVLQKLLVATDGPASTLVVTALSDGQHIDQTDLQVQFSIPTVVGAGDVTAYAAAIGALPTLGVAWTAAQLQQARLQAFETLIGDTVDNTLPGVANFDAYGEDSGTAATYTGWYSANDGTIAPGDSYASAFANAGGSIIQGANSGHVSDNTIYVAGNSSDKDVVVLSTGGLSNDKLVWEGMGNGTVTVVNFDATDTVGASTAAHYNLAFTGTPTNTSAGTITIHLPGLGDVTVSGVIDTGGALGGSATANATAITAALTAFVATHSDWSLTGTAAANNIVLTYNGGTTLPGFAAPTLTLGGTVTGTLTLNPAGSADFTYAAPGGDTLDFTSYEDVYWLGAAVLDNTTHVATGGWDVADTAFNAVSTNASAVTVDDSTARSDTNLHVNDKYITLTRNEDTGHASTLYKVELWQAKGTDLDAQATATGGDAEDQLVGVIGYVDVGRVIEGTLTVDGVLANIVY